MHAEIHVPVGQCALEVHGMEAYVVVSLVCRGTEHTSFLQCLITAARSYQVP